MQNTRINPQAVAAQAYSPQIHASVSRDQVVQDALEVIRSVAAGQAPVRAIVAKPAPAPMAVPTDNIAVAAESLAYRQGTHIVGANMGANVGANIAAANAEIRRQYAELAAKHAEVAAQLSRAQSDLDEVTAQSIGNSDHIEGMNVQIAQLTEENSQLTEEVEALKAKYAAAVEASRARHDHMTAEINRMAQQLSGDCDSTLAQLINAQENVESLTEELEATKSECESLRREIAEHHESKRIHNAVIDRLHKQLEAEKYNRTEEAQLRIATENKLAETEGKLTIAETANASRTHEHMKCISERDQLAAEVVSLKNTLAIYAGEQKAVYQNFNNEQARRTAADEKLAKTESVLKQIRAQEDQYRAMYETEKQRNAQLAAAATKYSETLTHWQNRAQIAEAANTQSNVEALGACKRERDTYHIQLNSANTENSRLQGALSTSINVLTKARADLAEVTKQRDVLASAFKQIYGH